MTFLETEKYIHGKKQKVCTNFEELAEKYATKHHQGQFRRFGAPYITHPQNVVKYLKKYGFDDEETVCIGWLHDIIEESGVTFDLMRPDFSNYIANGVHILTRNVGEDEYKKRLNDADNKIKAVKLCDTLDNISTLHELRPTGIMRKIVDCGSFYIPMAEKINPQIAKDMEEKILNYLSKNSQNYSKELFR